MIVGISGKFCSGKSTVAQFLTSRMSFTELSFAEPLKEVCRILFSMQSKDRGLLQWVGMALRGVDEDVFVDRLVSSLCQVSGDVVVADVRFKNEAQSLRKAGAYLLRLKCGQEERLRRHQVLYGERLGKPDTHHRSETDLDDENFDLVIDTQTCNQSLVNALVAEFVMGKRGETNADADQARPIVSCVVAPPVM